jgi:hypothetical protein
MPVVLALIFLLFEFRKTKQTQKRKTLASPPAKPDTRVTPIQERSG